MTDIQFNEHATLSSLFNSVEGSGFVFFAIITSHDSKFISLVSKRSNVKIDKYKGSTFITFREFSVDDIVTFAPWTEFVLIRDFNEVSCNSSPRDVLKAIQEKNIRTFIPYGRFDGHHLNGKSCSVIGTLEFLASDYVRLKKFPATTGGWLGASHNAWALSARVVFVLDLIQDFEILKPLLLRAASPSGCLDCIVAVSDTTFHSSNWAFIRPLLESLKLRWQRVTNSADIVGILGKSKSVLVTASESNARAHALCYGACRLASALTTRITIQHGYENVGMRHHLTHDNSFKESIRFASDVVLTWSDVDILPNIHPSELDKCIPVGIVKSFAEDAARVREGALAGRHVTRSGRSKRRFSLLLAENLHSVRFSTPSKYFEYLSLIRDIGAMPEIDLNIRSHPAKPRLSADCGIEQIKFVEGPIPAEAMYSYDRVISPPSTIILDSVLVGVPVSVWTNAPETGDVANYRGLSIVKNLGEFVSLTKKCDEINDEIADSLRWAVSNTCALNGAPYAWSQILQLAH